MKVVYLASCLLAITTVFTQELRPQQTTSPAKIAPISIENADEAELIRGEESDSGILKLKGRIQVQLPEGRFIADTVIIDTQMQEIYAQGDLVYYEKKNGTKIKAERMIYNRKLFQGILYNASGYKHPIYFIGSNIRQLAEQRLSVSHIRFTTNEARPPHYHFSAKRMWFSADNTFFAVGIWYYVGGVPLLPLPFFYTSPWGTGIVSQLGRGETQGNFIQNTYTLSAPHSQSLLLPQSYTFAYDQYQNTGRSFGLGLTRDTPKLSYQADLGYAQFKRYTINDGAVTNQVQICTGSATSRVCTTGEDEHDWKKTKLLLNSKKHEAQKNHLRNFYIFYENYSHYRYDYEFDRRFKPDSTLKALNQNLRPDGGTLLPRSGWELVYDEQWDTLDIHLRAQHREIWRERENFQESKYEKAQDILPSLDIHKRIALGSLAYFDTPVNWNHRLEFEGRQDYQDGQEFYTRNHNEYSTDIDLSLPLQSWLSWQTKSGYGNRKTVAQINDGTIVEKTSIEQDAARNSYQYWFSENELHLGESFLSLDITHRYKESFQEGRDDIPEISRNGFADNQNVNETEFYLEWASLNNTSFSLNTTYDQRSFSQDIDDKSRWHYPIFRSDVYLNWLHLFGRERENLLSRNKVHFVETHLINDHIYDPIQERSHSNVLSLSFAAGGFDLWLLRRLRYFEMGFEWYHVYFDAALDHMRYSLKTDIQLSKWIYLETVVESRSSDPERYRSSFEDPNNQTERISFWQDVVNSTGINGAKKRKDSVFNLAYLRSSLIFDLRDWELRLDYETEQKYIPDTSSTSESRIYYDQRISLGLRLIRFDIGGPAKNRGSRFLIDRQP